MTGAKEVDEQDDIYVLVAPQNAVGNCIINVRTGNNCIFSLISIPVLALMLVTLILKV